MKAGGRIIQDRNISINTDKVFEATYKKHSISVRFCRKENLNIYSIRIRNLDGMSLFTYIERCTIHDAIVYTLNVAML